MKKTLAAAVCSLALIALSGCTTVLHTPEGGVVRISYSGPLESLCQPAAVQTVAPGDVAASQQDGIIEFLGSEAQEFCERVAAGEPIVKLTYGAMHYEGVWYETDDRDVIDDVFGSLLDVKVGEPVYTSATDSDDVLIFELADGTQMSVLFNAGNLEVSGTEHYAVTSTDDLAKALDAVAVPENLA